MLEISIIGFFTGVLILVILILNLQSSPLANKLLIGVILSMYRISTVYQAPFIWQATGNGSVVAVPDYATIFQFGLGGAVCLDFKKK